MANKLKAAQFRVGQWVLWTDPDENDILVPHSGKVAAHTVHDGVRVYMVEEADSTSDNGVRLTFVLEEELSRLAMH